MPALLPGLALLVFLACGPAWAQNGPGSIAAGHELAEQWCAECHAIERGEYDIGIMGAPSFQERADDPQVTELYLRVFLQTPHVDMPNFRLTPEQTDNIIAYLLSLKGAAPDRPPSEPPS